MNKKLIFSVLLVVCLLTVVSVVVFAQSSPNVCWEYTVLSNRDVPGARNYAGMVRAMNRLGAEGWEMVGAPGDGTEFVFKRRLP